MIEQWILPHLSIGKRGFKTTVPLIEIVECILYRLKTGCQWRELPTKAFFTEKVLSWNAVFYYYNKWSKAGCWKQIWLHMLKSNLQYLDLSSVEFDGSPRGPVIHRRKMVGMLQGIRGEKPVKQPAAAANALFISDSQGVMLAMSTPQEGQHRAANRHDLFQIQTLFEEICILLKEADIKLEGLFLNADPGFDSKDFRQACHKQEIMANVKDNPRNTVSSKSEPYQSGTHIFDEDLYQDRSVIEHANAWIDGFKALLVRFEFSIRNWMSLHFIAFLIIFLRKIKRKLKV